MSFEEVYSMACEDERMLARCGENAGIKSCITVEELNILRDYLLRGNIANM